MFEVDRTADRSLVHGGVAEYIISEPGRGPALEFAVETGHVAVPLTAWVIPVAVIELAAALVRQLRARVSIEKLPVVVGDMATVPAAG